MSEPKWIDRQDVEDIHDIVIEIGGGSSGLRDPSLLESALGRPQNHYAYGETNIFQLDAGYAEGISRNHPFVDGNKRTAFQTASQFLRDNGYQLQRSEGTRHSDLMVDLAKGTATREEMGAYLMANSQPIEQEQRSSPRERSGMEELKEKAKKHLEASKRRQSQKQGQGEDI